MLREPSGSTGQQHAAVVERWRRCSSGEGCASNEWRPSVEPLCTRVRHDARRAGQQTTDHWGRLQRVYLAAFEAAKQWRAAGLVAPAGRHAHPSRMTTPPPRTQRRLPRHVPRRQSRWEACPDKEAVDATQCEIRAGSTAAQRGSIDAGGGRSARGARWPGQDKHCDARGPRTNGAGAVHDELLGRARVRWRRLRGRRA